MEPMTRRDLLKGIGAATVGAAVWLTLRHRGDASSNPQRKRVLRIAHLTDSHVAPEGIAVRGF
jgi:hypothetical protein